MADVRHPPNLSGRTLHGWLLCLVLLAAVPAAGAETVEVVGQLDSVRYIAPAVWDPRPLPEIGCPAGCAYIVGGIQAGGRGNYSHDDIVAFDPTTGASFQAARLPYNLEGASAVYAHGLVYIFGGRDPGEDGVHINSTAVDSILAFDPLSGNVTDTGVHLRLRDSAAVWVPETRPGQACSRGCAYLFGGYPRESSKDVLRFDPVLGNVSVVAQLPMPVTHESVTSAALAPSGDIYIFGGAETHESGYGPSSVLRFTPETGEVAVAASLPAGTQTASATLHGHCALIFGGYGRHGPMDGIVAFDTRNESARVLDASLPHPVSHIPAVAAGTSSYLFSGRGEGWTGIVRFDPTSACPDSVEEAVEGVIDEVANITDATADGLADDAVSNASACLEGSAACVPDRSEPVNGTPGAALNATLPANQTSAAVPNGTSSGRDEASATPPDERGDGQANGTSQADLPPSAGSREASMQAAQEPRQAPGWGDYGAALAHQVKAWFAQVVLVAGVSGAVVLVSTQPIRHALYVRLGALPALAFLFSRITGPKMLDQKVRSRIYYAIQEHPGIHYRGLRRTLQISQGGLSYHLARLKDAGLVMGRRQGNRVLLYVAGPRREAEPDVPGKVLQMVEASPGLSQADLARMLGVARQTVSYHVKHLLRRKMVRMEPNGRSMHLFSAG